MTKNILYNPNKDRKRCKKIPFFVEKEQKAGDGLKQIDKGSKQLWHVYLWTLSFLKPYTGKVILVIMSGFVITLSELIIPKFIQYFIETILPAKDFSKMNGLLLGLTGLIVLGIILTAARNLWQRKLIEQASRDSQFAAFQQIRQLGFSYYEQHSVSETLSFVNTQTRAVQEIYRRYFPQFINQILFIAISLFFMINISIFLTLIIIPSFILYYVFGPWLEKKATIYGRQSAEGFRTLQTKLYESLASMEELRILGYMKWDMERIQRLHEKVRQNHEKNVFFAYLRGSNRRLTYYIGALATFGIGIHLVKTGQLTTGGFVAYILYYFSAMHMLTSIVTLLTEQRILTFQIEPLYHFMKKTPDIREPQQPVHLDHVEGDIEFHDVSFHYPNHPPLLKGMNLHIRKGEKVALVGTSGGGKTSLLKLIGRFYDPSAGMITLNGVDLRHLPTSQIRGAMGFVFQETFLFNMSVKDNIRFGDTSLSDQQIIEAAKKADCDSFIRELENGYDTILGERGLKLSGGQKQKIAIARLFAKNPSVVLLDEATASLDNVSEQKVQQALHQTFKDSTVIAVAHRLSTVRHFDRIIFIKDGCVLETGSFYELMRKKGHFYQLASDRSEKEAGVT
ncbi:ABC transporter ATP-binding protein [Bacillus safensis]|uniref:ABC transporter ATP-binding protein n=1 Tax=Bacillus safensis TaxID=561879 RepID=UPI00119ECD22